ncbi:MAG: flagellar hook-basal body complex protein [Oscillospiraceae bacterium]|nr:flagellar hook-basal body complex protein [Oscillospiraceae bacterium]
MLRGFYTAANAIVHEQRIINVKTNNLSNVGTAGFKSDTAIPTTFAEKMLLIQNRSDTGVIRYRTLQETFTNLEQGTWEETGSRLDMALRGSVFFNIARASDGEVLLTRNGQFNIDAEGYLALGSSGRVLDAAGNEIMLGTADFTVSEEGVITVSDGREIALGLTYVDEYDDVYKVADSLMRPMNGEVMGNIPPDYEYVVMQGAYERSNVNVAREMTEVMSAQSVISASANALKVANALNQTAANELMKIN